MNKAGKISIRREIFKSSMIFSLIILTMFGLFLSNILYHSEISKAYGIIKQRNHAINFYIDGYFTEINNTIEILGANKEVQDAPLLDSYTRQRVLDLYKSFAEANKNITYIYSGYKNGLLLINDYTPPEGFDPVVRPWYQSAMATNPDTSTGLPYQDIKNKEWLISTSKALPGVKNGYDGVVSIDSSIDMIADLLKQRGKGYESSYSFVTKSSGKIIIHHNESFLNKSLSTIVDSPVSLNKKEGQFTYYLGNTKKIAYYSRINGIGWVVVTVVEKKEIIRPIILQIFFNIMLTGLIAVLFGVAQSALLSRRFSNPLVALQKRVNAIICGNWNNNSDYKYPDNEIGVIAREFGQLAEHELYAKSIELQEANSRINAANTLLEQKNNELKILSTTDQLTELYNRHKIDTELENECKRSVRYKRHFSVIMFDIDWFKKINDTYGHQAGDSVLKEISLLLKENLRATDIPARWGGEEFLVLCPETNLEGA